MIRRYNRSCLWFLLFFKAPVYMIRIQPDYLRKISGKLREKEIMFLAMPSEKRAAYKNVSLMLGK